MFVRRIGWMLLILINVIALAVLGVGVPSGIAVPPGPAVQGYECIDISVAGLQSDRATGKPALSISCRVIFPSGKAASGYARIPLQWNFLPEGTELPSGGH